MGRLAASSAAAVLGYHPTAARTNASMGSTHLGLGLQHTHLQTQEATLLYAIVHAMKPRHLVEVGSFQGGSVCMITQALIDAGQPSTPATFVMIDREPRLDRSV
jgi:cephalosporin hydroxylase